jgi:hypothetical protein
MKHETATVIASMSGTQEGDFCKDCNLNVRSCFENIPVQALKNSITFDGGGLKYGPLSVFDCMQIQCF